MPTYDCHTVIATALIVSTVEPICPFLIRKCAETSVFFTKTVKIRWR